MSRILTAALGAAVVIGMAGVAGAQAPVRQDSARWLRHGQMAARHGERGERGKFMKDLNLTDVQKNQIKAIHKKYEPQMKQIREQGKAQFGDMRAARQKGDTSAATRAKFQQFRERTMAVRQKENSEIRGILTADQRTRWDAAQAQRKEHMRTHQKGAWRAKTGKA
jgi:Spy/CpxP family protein refolding chaperone